MISFIRFLLILILSIWLLSSCSSSVKDLKSSDPIARNGKVKYKNGVISLKDQQVIPLDLAKANQVQPLRFGQEDQLKITIWGHPELDHFAKVQTDGDILVPLIGSVQAEGKTAEELQKEIEEGFKDKLTDNRVLIKREDVIKLMVWRHPDLTHVATVQMDGYVTLPLVGEIYAEGKTITDLRREVTRALGSYINDPQVSILPELMKNSTIADPQVSVLAIQLRDRKVSVLGEVNVPGLIPIHGKMQVMDAIAQVGYRRTSNLNSVILIRNPDSFTPEYRRLALWDFMNGDNDDQNVFLMDGDIVIVPKTFMTNVGEFIEDFFTRTKPVFDWWIALQYARYAEDVGKTTRRLNDLLLAQ